MGVWGAGLYSGDFALDLRSTIRAVARLPYDGDKLVEILCETEPAAANVRMMRTTALLAGDRRSVRQTWHRVGTRPRESLKIIDNGSDIACSKSWEWIRPG